MIGCAGHNLLSLGCFLLSWSVCCVRLHCRTMSVWVDLCLLGFEPYRELVQLVSVVVLLFYFLYVSRFCLCWRCTWAGTSGDPDVVLSHRAFWMQVT